MSCENEWQDYLQHGCARFPSDAALARWAAYTLRVVPTIVADPSHAQWHRHQGTWFVGVDALGNDPEARLPGGPPLAGVAIDFIRTRLNYAGPWHAGQLSVCYPGFPQQDIGESAAAHAFRLKRDSAHVDGLHGEGEPKRRFLRESHAFILGLPLTDVGPGASPFVIWESSHHIMRDMFVEALSKTPPERWGDVDLTGAYQSARARVFETCRRLEIHLRPGEAFIAHRLSVHGVKPWVPGAAAPAEGRAIAYFRPEIGPEAWLQAP